MAIYLDHAATTPIHLEVREAMLPYLEDRFGNPSSMHRFGREIRNAIDQARDQVAGGLAADPGNVIFTSGGTEADNLALVGAAFARREVGRNHIITSAVEHHAVLDTCAYLKQLGFKITILPVDETGCVDPAYLRESIDEKTAVVSVMMGNNEVGTLQPIVELGTISREFGAWFHTDAVQAYGVESIDVQSLPVDLVTISSHKINGPKGVGALWLAQEVNLWPQMHGGQQERRRRAGTENVPGIVGFGKAAQLATRERPLHRDEAIKCREAMIAEWRRAGIDFQINGHPTRHLPHILNVSFPGTETETMLMNLDLEGIACASGSACTSGTLEISHVLQAMNLSDPITQSAIRFSFGLGNTPEQVASAARTVVKVVQRLTAS
ncbi:cysteine desulfurase family protein [Marininema halotolerans]|uniref:cysteine desulfurase n=1 Tax=Marininema halotolerans TaxID=1155944 RepID=A0A1I6U735_9BACL|nr:cysteine desulfurase family protein [Marininema halotolerans]SFS97235.1 cysteine desulfurase [Marininema halotolerans]